MHLNHTGSSQSRGLDETAANKTDGKQIIDRICEKAAGPVLPLDPRVLRRLRHVSRSKKRRFFNEMRVAILQMIRSELISLSHCPDGDLPAFEFKMNKRCDSHPFDFLVRIKEKTYLFLAEFKRSRPFSDSFKAVLRDHGVICLFFQLRESPRRVKEKLIEHIKCCSKRVMNRRGRAHTTSLCRPYLPVMRVAAA